MSDFPYYGPLPLSLCPRCNYKLDAATKAHGENGPPDEGSASVCLNCGQVLIYEADLTLREATAEEIQSLMRDWDAWKVIEEVQHFIRQRGANFFTPL